LFFGDRFMKKCPECQVVYPFSESACPSCGFRPSICEGFPAYAQELNRGEHSFSFEAYRNLAAVEAGSFWFQARNRMIIRVLSSHCGGMESFLEIGCGTGFVLSGIRQAFPGIRLLGSEVATDGLGFAAERLPGIPLIQMDARGIPFSQEVDVIGAFDVLEHIQEDEKVMAEVHTALKPNGFFVITVPQHMWLWSAVDDASKHFRRYTKPELHGKLARQGFRVLFSTSFVFLLLPAMLLSRQKQKADCELRLPVWMNAACAACMRLEEFFIRCGIILPVGGSRLVVAQRI
jgi:SAM-dependent methyltransferase